MLERHSKTIYLIYIHHWENQRSDVAGFTEWRKKKKNQNYELELFQLRVVKTDYTRTMSEESVPKKPPLGCSFLLWIFTSLLE